MASGILKWGGLVGALALVASAVLRASGLNDLANALSSLGGILGSDVPAGDIAAAVLSGASVVKKFWLEYQRIKSI